MRSGQCSDSVAYDHVVVFYVMYFHFLLCVLLRTSKILSLGVFDAKQLYVHP